jgi:SPASM domain peptide maturase of grasp-with-spasm system
MNKKYFNLFSCCIPVCGGKKAAICDLQRNKIYSIPLFLCKILVNLTNKGISIQEIKSFYENEYDSLIDEYLFSLESIECGIFSDDYKNFPLIDLNNYHEAKPITNAIVDFSNESKHSLNKIVTELSMLKCEALELRFFDTIITIFELREILKATDNSTLRSVEILMLYNESFSINNIIDLRKNYSRLQKITLYNSNYNKIIEHVDICILYTKQNISENDCGVVSPWYFISKTENFIEARHYNSCLNKKISVDRLGYIRNCPSMKISYGNIKNTSLIDVLDKTDFKSIWSITKDNIAVCKDCQYRYVCIDCRAFISNDDNVYSKPMKCNYNPYTNTTKK